MKIMERFTKKITSKASTAVKSEVKKTAIDILPKLIGIGAMIFGIAIFKEVIDMPLDVTPSVSNTSITTNNYFFQSMSEEAVKRILEGK